MKLILVFTIFAALALFASAQQCTESMQIACVDDFRAAYPVCKKAAEAGGADPVADMACMKYFTKMQPECWPCICWFGKEFNIPIKGC